MQTRGARTRRRVVSVIVAGLCACGAGTALADTPTRLKPGARPVERPLAGAGSHRYTITLKAGEYTTIRVRQAAIDVVALVEAPDGTRIGEVDTPRRTTGDEVVEIVATQSGPYTITVRAREDDAPKARYAIGLDRPRKALDADHRRVAALRAFERAELLRREGTAESLARALAEYETARGQLVTGDQRAH